MRDPDNVLYINPSPQSASDTGFVPVPEPSLSPHVAWVVQHAVLSAVLVISHVVPTQGRLLDAVLYINPSPQSVSDTGFVPDPEPSLSPQVACGIQHLSLSLIIPISHVTPLH